MTDSLRVLGPGEANYIKEARRIQKRALAGDTRLVRIGPILFFFVNGDAWMLDLEDQLSRCLVEAGEKLSLGIIESRTQFSVEWTGRYEIKGEVFAGAENDGRVRSITGYPTAKILELSQGN